MTGLMTGFRVHRLRFRLGRFECVAGLCWVGLDRASWQVGWPGLGWAGSLAGQCWAWQGLHRRSSVALPSCWSLMAVWAGDSSPIVGHGLSLPNDKTMTGVMTGFRVHSHRFPLGLIGRQVGGQVGRLGRWTGKLG